MPQTPDYATTHYYAYGSNDGTNVVVLAASGKRVILHTVTGGAVAAGTALKIMKGDGTTRYSTTANAIDMPSPIGFNVVLDWTLDDGLSIQALGAAIALSGWVLAYTILPA